MEIRYENDGYEARAFDFKVAEDMYLFFEFESPKNRCTISIAYDVFVDGGEWYVADGDFDYDDQEAVDYIIDNLEGNEKARRFLNAIDRAIKEFNEED